jgi:hypothetical protein
MMNGMSIFTPQEAQKRASDPDKVVRSWSNSPVTRNIRGEITAENPDFHNTIGQREDGSYEMNGTPLPKSKVPAYILAYGRPPAHYFHQPVAMTFEEAENNTAANVDVPPPMPPAKKRGRPRKGA